jgi:DNA-binding beta-propeller fold protein YncE
MTALALVAAAACTAGSRPAITHRTASGPAAETRAGSRHPVPVAGAPGCSTATASAPALHRVPATMGPVPGAPFGVAVTADGRWAFVSLPGSGSVGVFRVGAASVPTLIRQVVPAGQPLGEALTRNGRYLLAADDGAGVGVISVSRAEQGQPGAPLGTLNSPKGIGAIEVAASPDGRFAFVSLEDSDTIAVFNLQRALTRGFGAGDFVGTIPVGIAPVGLAVSPDGRWLYATSEIATMPRAATGGDGQGTLTVISLDRAEISPAASVVATVTAGCSPVRVVTSADGRVLWVTARGSDRLLAFSAARLRTDPVHALIASVEVGEAPVGLVLADRGQRMVVADSNRFGTAGAASSLAVVSVPQALAGKPALLGYLPAGGFPREMALEPSGRTLLVTDFSLPAA